MLSVFVHAFEVAGVSCSARPTFDQKILFSWLILPQCHFLGQDDLLHSVFYSGNYMFVVTLWWTNSILSWRDQKSETVLHVVYLDAGNLKVYLFKPCNGLASHLGKKSETSLHVKHTESVYQLDCSLFP